MKPEFFVSRRSYGDGYDLKFAISHSDGSISVARPVVIERFEAHQPPPVEPMIALHFREAEPALQSLMDQLWNAGFRPGDVGTAGHLAATQAHLKDMRALVAKTLDVTLP